MSIEETYKGMWSSDATLLKSLLDAGNTIIENGYGSTTRLFEKRDGRYWIGDDAYSIDEFLREWNYYGGSEFLIPPRPLVLEPKPLEWETEFRKQKVARDDNYTYRIWSHGVAEYVMNGDWRWQLILKCEFNGSGFAEAEKAVNEWRVNHLKSMLP